jgi:hypothetical protein
MAARSPGSSRLENLPSALLVQILNYLPPAGLARIYRTSKTFLNLSEPLLYAEIEIKSDILIALAFYHLIRTITSRPSLGSYVRRLELVFRQADDRLFENNQDDAYWNVLDLPRISAYLSTLPCFKPPEMWENGLAEHRLEVLSTILLYHVLNARTIRLDEAYMEGTMCLPGSLVSLDGLGFPYLSTIETWSGAYESCCSADEAAPLLHFLDRPSIRKAAGVITDRNIELLPRVNPPIFTITDLHCGFLSPSSLLHLLTLTPELQSLQYRPWSVKEIPAFDCGNLHLALCRVNKTIQRIIIQPGRMCTRDVDGSMGSLRAFESLEELELPWVLLATLQDKELRDILPRNLRRLRTNGLMFECVTSRARIRREELFDTFFSEWWEYTPHLEAIVGEGSYTLSGPAERGRRRLRGL